MEKIGYSRHKQALKISSRTVKHHVSMTIVESNTGNHTTISQEAKGRGGMGGAVTHIYCFHPLYIKLSHTQTSMPSIHILLAAESARNMETEELKQSSVE